MTDRITMRVAVYVVVERAGKILYLRRHNSEWNDGKLTVPAGHIDQGETPLQSAVRELKEEVGLDISLDQIEFFHTHYNVDRYVDFYFRVKDFSEEPKLMEPDKSSELLWKDIGEYDEVIDNVRLSIESGYLKGESISYSDSDS